MGPLRALRELEGPWPPWSPLGYVTVNGVCINVHLKLNRSPS